MSRAALFSIPSERTTMISDIITFCKHFLQEDDGPTAVEYAVMLALIIVVCILAIATLGQNAKGTFKYVGSQLTAS
jgi:pilus assembly protein Flp/PilA